MGARLVVRPFLLTFSLLKRKSKQKEKSISRQAMVLLQARKEAYGLPLQCIYKLFFTKKKKQAKRKEYQSASNGVITS